MATLSDVDRLARDSVAAERRQRSLLVRLILALLGVWGQADVHKGQSAAAAAARSVILVAAAQRQARMMEQAAQSRFLDIAGGSLNPYPVSVDYPRYGVDPFTVWDRVSTAARVAEAQGGGDQAKIARDMATKAGAIELIEHDHGGLVGELAKLAREDVALAKRDEARRARRRAGVTYYRRVLHPELSRTGPCGLCFVAATQVYKAHNLQPLHDRCVCTEAPIVGDIGGKGDPGIRLNQRDFREVLDAVYGTEVTLRPDGGAAVKEVAGTDSFLLSKVRVMEVLHSERGPVLTSGSQVPDWARKGDLPEGSTWKEVQKIARERARMGGSAKDVQAFVDLGSTAAVLARATDKGSE